MEPKLIQIELPEWMREPLALATGIFAAREERMDFAINLARMNVKYSTGGPFAAAVFDTESGRLIAAGVNLVTNIGLSIAHAEMVALMQAQAALGSFDLGANGMPRCELVTTTAPCAMCLGAVPWSGVRALVCGARDEDARAVGFDEGSKRPDWVKELENRGIEVALDVRRDDAAAILRDYVNGGGVVYNGRRG
ncbi:MAG: nucleoside deaminase [Chitinispirillia bacterium]|nr:nucleoside deaminase [Chitinispirillia bacterium]MCL2269375.1 nucleoside deaminase [Chitinispirillia bacterium]